MTGCSNGCTLFLVCLVDTPSMYNTCCFVPNQLSICILPCGAYLAKLYNLHHYCVVSFSITPLRNLAIYSYVQKLLTLSHPCGVADLVQVPVTSRKRLYWYPLRMRMTAMIFLQWTRQLSLRNASIGFRSEFSKMALSKHFGQARDSSTPFFFTRGQYMLYRGGINVSPMHAEH